MGGDEDDWDDLWADFNDDAALESESISANLRMAAGLKAGAAVHAGDVDEGQINWEAPAFHGLGNSEKVNVVGRGWHRDDETEDMWAALAPEGAEEMSISSNLLEAMEEQEKAAARAVDNMQEEAVVTAATTFQRHEPRLDLDTFKQLVVALTENEEGTALLDLLITRKKIRAHVKATPAGAPASAPASS